MSAAQASLATLRSNIADVYYEPARKLVAACDVTYEFSQPWLANRTRYPIDGRYIVSIDKRIPKILKCGVDTSKSLPWHELSELLAMNDGLPYDHDSPGGKDELTAHNDVATPLERREVERQKPEAWKAYTEEMDGYILEVDDEKIVHVMPDQDTRQFEEDDKALLRKIIAAERSSKATDSLTRIFDRADPTGTTPLRDKFIGEINRRFDALGRLCRSAIVDAGLFGVTAEMIMHGGPADRFRKWIDEASRQLITDGNSAWTLSHVWPAAAKGFLDARKGGKRLSDAGPPDEPRDPHGKWTSGGRDEIESGEGDDLVTLYHGTTPEGEAGIRQTGLIHAPAYFTNRRDAAEEYAGNNSDDPRVIKVKIPKAALKIDREGYDGPEDIGAALEAGVSVYSDRHVRIGKAQHTVSTSNS